MSHDTPNPYNLKKQIALHDQNGNFLRNISQREAGKFLRFSHAQLLLQYPPAIQLTVFEGSIDNECDSSCRLRATKRESAAKSLIYGNYTVQNIDGREMFHCDAVKVLWYLNRNLVDIISNNPPIVRFNFHTNGHGHVNDKYYLTPKVNRCVVCGKENKLSRHHVVPHCFRRHMPEEIKCHSYHDVLLLCMWCHESYERFADKLKVELSKKHNINQHPNSHIDREKLKIAKFVHALLLHEEKIPLERRNLLYGEISLYFNKEIVRENLEEIISELDFYTKEESQYEKIVLSEWSLQEFVEMWRKHFVESMNPQYMPEFWDLKKSIEKTNKELCNGQSS